MPHIEVLMNDPSVMHVAAAQGSASFPFIKNKKINKRFFRLPADVDALDV
jgi:hypothetical protein